MTMNNFAPFVAAFFSVSVCLCICVYLCASMFAVLCIGGCQPKYPPGAFFGTYQGGFSMFSCL